MYQSGENFYKSFLEIMTDRPTNQPTNHPINRPTDRMAWGFIGKLYFQEDILFLNDRAALSSNLSVCSTPSLPVHQTVQPVLPAHQPDWEQRSWLELASSASSWIWRQNNIPSAATKVAKSQFMVFASWSRERLWY